MSYVQEWLLLGSINWDGVGGCSKLNCVPPNFMSMPYLPMWLSLLIAHTLATMDLFYIAVVCRALFYLITILHTFPALPCPGPALRLLSAFEMCWLMWLQDPLSLAQRSDFTSRLPSLGGSWDILAWPPHPCPLHCPGVPHWAALLEAAEAGQVTQQKGSAAPRIKCVEPLADARGRGRAASPG